MLKLVSKLFAGLVFFTIGSYIIFLYTQELKNGNNLALLLIAGFLLTIAGFFFIEALRPFIKKKQTHQDQHPAQEGLANVIQKNNEMDAEFGKTNDARNRLRMLELSADANKGS